MNPIIDYYCEVLLQKVINVFLHKIISGPDPGIERCSSETEKIVCACGAVVLAVVIVFFQFSINFSIICNCQETDSQFQALAYKKFFERVVALDFQFGGRMIILCITDRYKCGMRPHI